MGKKATGKSTPERKRQPERAKSRAEDDAKVMRTLRLSPRPELQVHPSSPFAQEMAAQQKRMQLLGEKLDLNRLRKAATSPPQEPTPQPRKRGHGGGRKPSLSREQITEGIRILESQPKMTVEAARQTLRDAGIDTKNTALYELVIRPAYGSR
jgi:hypothetical protein